MDVDSDSPASSSSSTDVLSYFDLSPTSFPWRDPVYNEIESRRALLDDTLLFDILLNLGGIEKPETLYPPPNVQALEELLKHIAESPAYDGLKKDGLVYYLLKWHRDGREMRFQRERSIPPQFVALADAYWCLDSGIDISRAVSQLSDPRLNRDYASKIMQIISLSKVPEPEPLVVKYVRTAKPRLEEPEDIDTYTLALAHSNLFEAWQYQRTFCESNPTRERLLRKLIQWCVSPSPKPSALTYLLTLPLSVYEQNILHKYASSPPKDDNLPANAVPILQNLACVRLIQQGRHAEAVKMHRSFIAASTSTNGKGKATATSNQTLFQERDEMIQEVYHALPAVERNLLDAELESGGLGTIHQSVPVAKSRPSTSNLRKDPNAAAAPGGDASGDISMSWEDIPRPPSLSSSINGFGKTPNASGSGANTPLNFSLSAAPKFGGSVFPPSSSTTPTLSTTQKPKPIEGLPPPSLSATALNLFGASTSSAATRKSAGGFNPLGASTSSSAFGKSFSASTTSRPPIIPTSFSASTSTTGNAGDISGFSSSFGASTSTLFMSSARKENAFFKPATQQNGSSAPSGSGSARRLSGSASQSPERPREQEKEQENDGDADMEVDELNLTANGRDSDSEAGLNYSVFEGKKDTENASAVTSSGWEQPSQNLRGKKNRGKSDGHGHDNASNSISAMSTSTSSRVPGSFMDEEEEEEDEQDNLEAARETRKSSRAHHTQSQPQPTRQTRGSRKSAASATTPGSSQAVSGKSKSRQSISAGMKRSVPGSMYDDEEDDDGASSVHSDVPTIHEEDDSLAPLPTRRTPRKTRSSVVVDEDGAGATKTRRRSSRLSTTTDAATSSRKGGTRASKGETTGKSGRKKR